MVLHNVLSALVLIVIFFFIVCITSLFTDTGYLYEQKKFESWERINSMRETNGNFDSCNSYKRLVPSRWLSRELRQVVFGRPIPTIYIDTAVYMRLYWLTHVNGWEQAVYMSHMSQHFRLFQYRIYPCSNVSADGQLYIRCQRRQGGGGAAGVGEGNGRCGEG